MWHAEHRTPARKEGACWHSASDAFDPCCRKRARCPIAVFIHGVVPAVLLHVSFVTMEYTTAVCPLVFFAKNGVIPRQACVEGLQQIGRVERLGGMFKAVSKRQTREPLVTGLKDIRIAAADATCTKNNQGRNGSFSPSQQVLGTLSADLVTSLMKKRLRM